MTVVPLHPHQHTVPATLTDYQRRRYSASAADTVPCPYCKAMRGMQCVSTVNGHTTWTHAKRKRAVAHLTEEERVAAYASLQAERQRSRDEWDAQMRRDLADPQWVANRDATRKWWDDQLAAIREQSRREESDFRSRCTDRPFKNFRTHADGCRCLHTGEVEYTPEFAKAKADRERRESLRGVPPVTDLAARRGVR